MQATENEELAHKAHNEIVRAASKLLDEGLPIGLVINALLTEIDERMTAVRKPEL